MLEFNSTLTAAHVATGALAVAAGAVALAARKGAAAHIGAGRVFATAMLASSGLGAALGLIKIDNFYITFHAGVLGVTLIASAWLAAAARGGRKGPGTVFFGFLNMANMTGLIAAGAVASGQANGALFGYPAEDYFFLAAMAGLAFAGDINMVFRKALSDRHRIARHLWRMCLGFFIAAGSAFTGPGTKAFPEAIKQSGVLSLPELVIFVLMLFWLVRTLMRRPAQSKSAA